MLPPVLKTPVAWLCCQFVLW